VYNWIVEFFSEHSHCTRYGGSSSALLDISASIIIPRISYWSSVLRRQRGQSNHSHAGKPDSQIRRRHPYRHSSLQCSVQSRLAPACCTLGPG